MWIHTFEVWIHTLQVWIHTCCGACSRMLQEVLEKAIKISRKVYLERLLEIAQEPNPVFAINQAVVEHPLDLKVWRKV